MKNATLSLETIMDIFDWFDADEREEINSMLALGDGYEEALKEKLPEYSAYAEELVHDAIGTENEYPGAME